MTATVTGPPITYDARNYELLISVDHNGRVRIEHQAGDGDRADRAMLRLAAQIRDHHHDPNTVIVTPPPPGRTQLMCRCRRAVDAADLRWIGNARNSIRRVGCTDCAEAATW